MDLAEKLKAQQDCPTAPLHRPRVYDLSVAADALELEGLLPGLTVTDTLEAQLGDLEAARAPQSMLSAEQRAARIARILDGRPAHHYGRWIHYPWSARLVHLLPPHEFDELRGDRNRYRQLPAERRLLRSKTIAIAGLSVGQAAALTLALEGIGGHYRLADFDTLGLSNLNRLRAGVHELSLNKAVLTARALCELDPYLDIQIFPEGVTEAGIYQFLAGADLLVEECDDLCMKVRLREVARELGIPVVMETNERGMLDVERFDREPSRPILHGLVSGISARELQGLTTPQKLPFVLSLLGVDRLSPAAAASLCEVRVTLSAWPQLGSAVMLGGALVADAGRKVLLGELQESGRFYVDLDQLVRDGSSAPLPTPEPLTLEILPEARAERTAAALPIVSAGPISIEEIHFLVEHAILAPSGGNTQPWRFEWNGEHLDCWIDSARTGSFFDFEALGSAVALGTAVENLCIAATKLGRAVNVSAFPEATAPLLACRVTFGSTARSEASPLFDCIRTRVTNRRLVSARPLDPAHVQALQGALNTNDARLELVSAPEALARIGHWLGKADRLRLLCPAMHAELQRELRWTPEAVARTRDGIDVATLEVSPSERALMRVLSSPATMARLKQIGGGGALEYFAHSSVTRSSALGLLSVPGAERQHYFGGGRQLERVWLTATAHALALQPLALTFLLSRAERGDGLDEQERTALNAMRAPLRALFDVPDHHSMLCLFRVSYADAPSARSLRRPLTDVLTVRASSR
jgi:hypothetical protein